MDQDATSKRKSTADEPGSERRNHRRGDETFTVRLIRKYAEMIDGVNLEEAKVGDRLELSRRDADVLVAEGWAERTVDEPRAAAAGRAHAADNSRRRKSKR